MIYPADLKLGSGKEVVVDGNTLAIVDNSIWTDDYTLSSLLSKT